MKNVLCSIFIIVIIVFIPTKLEAASNNSKGHQKIHKEVKMEQRLYDQDNNVEVKLTAQKLSVDIGESVELTAVTPKCGSAFTEEWSGAKRSYNEKDDFKEEYLSKAVFMEEKAGIYTVKYNIFMEAGKSNKVFMGEASIDIEVKEAESISVKGAKIDNLIIKEITNQYSGNVYYAAQGNTYIVWSDNSLTPYSTIFFVFQQNEFSKDVNVSFTVNSEKYDFLVNVTRQ